MGCINILINRLDEVKLCSSVLDGEWREWVFIRVVSIKVFLIIVVIENIVLNIMDMM